MNILYIAYSCLPNKGSEEKIGWNIPLESSKTNNVYVITKEEHRQKIEDYFEQNGNSNNIKFFYVDIPKAYKKIFKGSMYSLRLNKWNKRALPIAKKVCEEYNIDIIHQITPIEFRSIGDYGKIKGPKFVCGPIGGGEYIPKGLFSYTKRYAVVEWMRLFLNSFYRAKFTITKKLSYCDYILFANKETAQYLKKLTVNVASEIYFDNGISSNDFSAKRKNNDKNKIDIIVAGRLAYRKGHTFLLDVLKEMPKDIEYSIKIIGDGPEMQFLKKKCILDGSQDKVIFLGKIPFEKMQYEYANADIFVMPSIRETTGAVLLEAASKSIPVITINRFGGAVLFDDDSAWLYEGNSKITYIDGLKVALLDGIDNPQKVYEKGKKAQMAAFAHTWDKKMEKYNSIYEKI